MRPTLQRESVDGKALVQPRGAPPDRSAAASRDAAVASARARDALSRAALGVAVATAAEQPTGGCGRAALAGHSVAIAAATVGAEAARLAVGKTRRAAHRHPARAEHARSTAAVGVLLADRADGQARTRAELATAGPSANARAAGRGPAVAARVAGGAARCLDGRGLARNGAGTPVADEAGRRSAALAAMARHRATIEMGPASEAVRQANGKALVDGKLFAAVGAVHGVRLAAATAAVGATRAGGALRVARARGQAGSGCTTKRAALSVDDAGGAVVDAGPIGREDAGARAVGQRGPRGGVSEPGSAVARSAGPAPFRNELDRVMAASAEREGKRKRGQSRSGTHHQTPVLMRMARPACVGGTENASTPRTV
jgi:hypothetical protein